MWRPERRRDVLRIGRQSVELWADRAREGMRLLARQPLDLAAEPDPRVLAEALRLLLSEAGLEQEQPKGRGRALDGLLESAWLPVMLLEPGPLLWSHGQVEALFRHRITQLHGMPDSEADPWRLQLDHRPGKRHALGYGMKPELRQGVLDGAAAAGWHVDSLQPAFAWGWQRWRRERRAEHCAWWVWIEQDRSLICQVERGKACGLNAGAPVLRDAVQGRRLIEIEAARQGVLPGPAMVVSWHEPAVRAASERAQEEIAWFAMAQSAGTEAPGLMSAGERQE